MLAVGLVLLASAAAAQSHGPSVATLAGPVVLRGESHRSRVDACGLSHGRSTAELHVVLTLAAGGTAVLDITGSSHSSIAPNAGGASSATGHAIRLTSHGVATASAGTVTVRFVDADFADVMWSGPGTLPPGAPTRRPFVHSITCSREVQAILPAGPPVAGEVASDLPIAHCRWDGGPPPELHGYTEGEHWLGDRDGIVETQETSVFEPDPVFSLRAAGSP